MKRSAVNANRGVWGRLFWRGFWALLALVHVAPLAAVLRVLLDGEISALLNLAALVPVLTFFALKALDVPLLRWRACRSSVIAFGLACVLVHQDVRPDAAVQAALAQTPAAAALAAAAETLRTLRRSARGWLLDLRLAIGQSIERLARLPGGPREAQPLTLELLRRGPVGSRAPPMMMVAGA